MNCDAVQRIKAAAQELGFEACGIAAVTSVDDEAVARYERWLDEGRNGCMDWAARHRELRNDPRELLEALAPSSSWHSTTIPPSDKRPTPHKSLFMPTVATTTR